MSLRCATYARYSSDQQSPLSISDQVRKCREYAQQHDWRIVEEHVYTDAEISGAGTDRPGLQALLQALQARPRVFDVLLIDDTSRLSRRQADQANIIDQLRFAGFRLVAVSQGIDTASEQADVLMTVHGLVDSLYIKELATVFFHLIRNTCVWYMDSFKDPNMASGKFSSPSHGLATLCLLDGTRAYRMGPAANDFVRRNLSPSGFPQSAQL